MKSIIVKATLSLGILGMGLLGTHTVAEAGYPTQHSIKIEKPKTVESNIGIMGYPTQH